MQIAERFYDWVEDFKSLRRNLSEWTVTAVYFRALERAEISDSEKVFNDALEALDEELYRRVHLCHSKLVEEKDIDLSLTEKAIFAYQKAQFYLRKELLGGHWFLPF